MVAVGSDILYTIQEDSDGGSLPITAAGLNADFIVAAGDTITGTSAMEIESRTALSTATLPLRLRWVDQQIGNALGTNAKWIVNINADQDDHGLGV